MKQSSMCRGMTRLSRGVWPVGLVCCAVACGARTGLLVPSTDAGIEETSVGEDASCAQSPVPVDPNVPNLYFVLDVSTSMNDSDKWTNMRTVVGDLIAQLGPTARFGAAVFPHQGTPDVCAPGIQVMSLRRGDTQGVTEGAFLQATNFKPLGGTPTAATIRALANELRSFRGPTFVILATDGGPNCDTALSCDISQCTSNIDGVPGCPVSGPSCCDPSRAGGQACLDGAGTVRAVATLASSGIQTYVLGLPGSASYASVLDAVATAGGTARATEPLYYNADTTTADPNVLRDALAEIAARAMASCAFTLAELPLHPNEVNVSVGGSVVHQSGPDGWSLQGTQLMLRGASCQAAQSQGSASPLSVTQGCPTVL
jgi:hypothetical protein